MNITILSNGSSEIYPDNKLTYFTNKLPNILTVYNREKWAISIKDITISTGFIIKSKIIHLICENIHENQNDTTIVNSRIVATFSYRRGVNNVFYTEFPIANYFLLTTSLLSDLTFELVDDKGRRLRLFSGRATIINIELKKIKMDTYEKIIICSSKPNDIYPNNNINDFTSVLPYTQDLIGSWEIALNSATYPKVHNNKIIFKEDNKIIIWFINPSVMEINMNAELLEGEMTMEKLQQLPESFRKPIYIKIDVNKTINKVFDLEFAINKAVKPHFNIYGKQFHCLHIDGYLHIISKQVFVNIEFTDELLKYLLPYEKINNNAVWWEMNRKNYDISLKYVNSYDSKKTTQLEEEIVLTYWNNFLKPTQQIKISSRIEDESKNMFIYASFIQGTIVGTRISQLLKIIPLNEMNQIRDKHEMFTLNVFRKTFHKLTYSMLSQLTFSIRNEAGDNLIFHEEDIIYLTFSLRRININNLNYNFL